MRVVITGDVVVVVVVVVLGTSRHRYMSLLIPKCDTLLVKTQRTVLDRSVSVSMMMMMVMVMMMMMMAVVVVVVVSPPPDTATCPYSYPSASRCSSRVLGSS